MMLFGTSCKAQICGHRDPASDTVKVDASLIKESWADEAKENVAPAQEDAPKEVRNTEAQQKQWQAEEHRREKEHQQAEAEMAAAEARRRAAEEETARVLMQKEAERRRTELQQREEAARLQRDAEERVRREREEQARRAAEEAAQKAFAEVQQEEELQQKEVQAFLRKHGFAGIRAGRRRMMRTSYPLHTAVTEKDARMVALLLRAGADASQKNSSGATPAQLAQKSNKHGSHEEMLWALQAQQ